MKRAGRRAGGKLRRVAIAHATLPTSLGKIWILATEAGVREIRLSEREAPSRGEMRERGWKLVRRPRWTDPAKKMIQSYLEGRERRLDLALDLGSGTPFQRRVWDAARRIPYGQVVSYADLARLADRARASRAVGNALGANPIPIVIPCHRIVHADRSLGGFSSGLPWKRFLLGIEQGQLAFSWKSRRRFPFPR